MNETHEIPTIDETLPIPDDAVCQEASWLSKLRYIACGQPAVAIIRHDKDQRSYYMCGPCANHNVRSRGGKVVQVKAAYSHWVR